MELFLYLIMNFVEIFLDIISLAMLVRAILSFFMFGEDSRLGEFLYAITEPFIIPFRILFEKRGWFVGMPLDVAFFATVITLQIVRTTLMFIPI